MSDPADLSGLLTAYSPTAHGIGLLARGPWKQFSTIPGAANQVRRHH